MKKILWTKYLLVFLITGAIFVTVVYFSDFASNKRLAEIKSMEDKISVDILSSETQFNLLAQSSCADLETTGLSEEMNSLADRLSYTEDRLGATNSQVVDLKRYYSLLEIKDYLLIKEISQKCKTKPLIVLYFYSNAGDCDECERMGYVLTYLRNEYPELRVYSFDYNLDLSALRTLRDVLKVENRLPAIVVDDKVYYGFKSLDDFDVIIPALKDLRAENASSSVKSATSTK